MNSFADDPRYRTPSWLPPVVVEPAVFDSSAPPPTVLEEAQGLITGDRADVYGDALAMARRISAGWSAIAGVEIPPEHISLMLAWLKIAREVNQHKRDNLVDLAGYAGVAESVLAGLEEEKLDKSPPSMHFDLNRLDDVEARACPHCSLDLEES